MLYCLPLLAVERPVGRVWRGGRGKEGGKEEVGEKRVRVGDTMRAKRGE
jgi:hypothetical protein